MFEEDAIVPCELLLAVEVYVRTDENSGWSTFRASKMKVNELRRSQCREKKLRLLKSFLRPPGTVPRAAAISIQYFSFSGWPGHSLD